MPSLEERRETPIWKRSPAIPRPFFSVPAASLWEDIAPRPAPSATTRLDKLCCGFGVGGWGDEGGLGGRGGTVQRQ